MNDDIRSKIIIEDEFSETLDTLNKATGETMDSVDDLNESLKEQGEQYDKVADAEKKHEGLLSKLRGQFEKISERVTGYTDRIVNLGNELTSFESRHAGMLKIFVPFGLENGVIDRAFDRMSELINNNIESVGLADKLDAMYGEASDVARHASHELANSIGEDTKEVTMIAAKAAQQGIGSVHFDRIMHLADRVGSLNVGDTTTGVAETLIQNIKSGHDAGTIASLYGGGEIMERQLRAAGYERALNRGDLDKALDIAEKIAKQAGYTDEAYERASNSLSKNWNRIGNFATNVKDRLGTIMSRSFAPLVKKIADFLTSPKVQNFLRNLEGVVSFVASKVSDAISWVIDHLDDIAKAGLVVGALKLLRIVQMIGIACGVPPIAITAAVAAGVGLFLLLEHILEELGVCNSVAGLLAGSFVFWKNVVGNIVIAVQNLGHKIAELYHRGTIASNNFSRFIRTKITDLVMFFVDKIHWALKASGLSNVFDFLGINVTENVEKMRKGLSEFAQFGVRDKGAKAMEEVQHRLDAMRHKFAHQGYTDALKGVDAAMKIESFGELGDKIGDWFSQFGELVDITKGIQGDTNTIRRINEQDEDLKWLKAFSDRQIMSNYNSSTSNIRNVTFNGMSQAGMNEMGRRNISTMPSRAVL